MEPEGSLPCSQEPAHRQKIRKSIALDFDYLNQKHHEIYSVYVNKAPTKP
jgi:hypothetical protein